MLSPLIFCLLVGLNLKLNQLIPEELEVGNWLEEFISNRTTNFKYEDPYNSTDNEGAAAAPPNYYTLPSLEDKMPFLQMLQTVEASQHHHQPFTSSNSPTFPLMQLDPNFQFLFKLQHHQKISCFTKPELINSNHQNNNNNNNNNGVIIMDLQSSGGVKSENEVKQIETQKSNCKNNNNKNNNNKKKKRKRSTRPVKNKEEVETQRMTHIAVERNRRRQMNEHLNALRSLMPPSYVQRGDQASIIGGAIDFVKELEQMLQSLEAQKKMRQCEENGDVSGTNNNNNNNSSSSNNLLYSSKTNIFMDSSSPFQQLRNQVHSHSPNSHSQEEGNGNGNGEIEGGSEGINGNGRKSSSNEGEYSAEKRTGIADIEVVVIQNHVSLKIQCQRRPGQLLKAILAFEELRLTVLHLNITSFHSLVHYSFNLKIEDDCELVSADDVARAVHQIFSLINLN